MKKYSLIIGLVTVAVLYAGLVFYFTPKDPAQDSSALVKEVAVLSGDEQPSFEVPVEIKIPAINLDAAIESVGLASDGSVDVPKDVRNVAWFNLGPRPGEIGSAVIDGHYGFANGRPSAFDDLHTLRIGDEIYVKNDSGASVSFVVTDIRRYDPPANTSKIFNSTDGKAHLNLITCEGVWDAATETYTQRLVVFADKE